MIKITIYKNSKGDYVGLRSFGHAGYAESGYDIICSAVSVLVINTINSIEAFTKDEVKIKMDKKKGLIEFKFVSDISEQSILLMKALELGLQRIKTDYNDGYIRIKLKEV